MGMESEYTNTIIVVAEYYIIVSGALGVYFLPTIIAFSRGHFQRYEITAVNILAFSFVCWIVPLIWSVGRSQKTPIKKKSGAEIKWLRERDHLPRVSNLPPPIPTTS